MKNTKIEIYKNSLGLEFKIKTIFVKTDDFGNMVNEYCVDVYSLAKMALYKDRTSFYTPDVEEMKISQIMAIGVNEYLKKLGI